MRRAVALAATLAFCACGGPPGASRQGQVHVAVTATASPTAAAPTPPPTDRLRHQPQRLTIPAINVDALVEPLGVVLAGKAAALQMAVPVQPADVGWYYRGAEPGDAEGAITFAGHLDWSTGRAVFWRLRELQPGAPLTVTTVNGNTYTYRVRSSADVHVGTPRPDLFTTAGSPVLALITCDGRWNGTTYELRRVVLADPVAA